MRTPEPLQPLHFPLFGTRLIEASAGTGKTYTIAALYVRLILGQGFPGTPLLPPEILVVTFTEAATKELRERIRQRLTEAAQCFRGIRTVNPDDEFLVGLLDSYPFEQHSGCARLLDIAAQWMDEAAIYTIHAWCKRMLKQHAFTSGSLFELKLDNTDTRLSTEVMRDYWRNFYYSLAPEMIGTIQKFAASPEELAVKLKSLSSLIGMNNNFAKGVNLHELPECFEQYRIWEPQYRQLADVARQQWKTDRQAIETLLNKASTEDWLDKRSYPEDTFAQRLQAIAQWAETNQSCDEKYLTGFAQQNLKIKKAHLDKPLKHPAFDALQKLTEHLERKPDLKAEALLHAACWGNWRAAQEKHRQNRLDFDDLVVNLHQALQGPSGPELAALLRKQFPIAMIDEFQDTDPIQYGIFNHVYPVAENPERLGLFMIGDPKQAIYSFRGADIFTYLQARYATANRHYTLTTNYRSTTELINAVNILFRLADRNHPQGAFLLKPQERDNPVPFLEVQAKGRQEQFLIDGQPQAALTFWNCSGTAPLGKTAYINQMAEQCAAEIVQLLNLGERSQAGFATEAQFKPLKPADVAVLVRDGTEAAAIQQSLQKRRINSVYLSDRNSVFKTQEARDMLIWLKACAEPGQDRLLRAALATATLRQSVAELDSLNQDELAWEVEAVRFHYYRKIWRTQGILAMLRQLLHDFGLPRQLLKLPNGERILTNLLHLSELLQTASMQGDGEHTLIRYLTEKLQNADERVDEHMVRLESEAEVVRIVTIHKAKGLEYPLVFLPFICTFKEVQLKNHSFYRFHDTDNRLQIDLELAENNRQKADQERLQEDMRLLYVALTRAQHACWLGIAALTIGNSPKCQLHKSALGTLLNAGNPIQSSGLPELLTKLQDACPTIAVSNIQESPTSMETFTRQDAVFIPLTRQFTGSKPRPWWIASYTAIKQEVGGENKAAPPLAPEDAFEANLLEFDESLEDAPGAIETLPQPGLHYFPRGAQPGTFLHGLLEWAAAEGFNRLIHQPEKRRAYIARRCQNRGWQDWAEVLDHWLVDLLQTPLPVSSGIRLMDLAPGSYQAELEFWFNAQEVSTLTLDALICAHLLPDQPRPALLSNQLNGMLKGFIDLVFCHEDCYYLIDYKSNHLGNDNTAYHATVIRDEMLKKRYDLQYVLYLLALHRQLKIRLGAAYDYDSHIGGAVYLFVRGVDELEHGVFMDKPSKTLIETLDQLFNGSRTC